MYAIAFDLKVADAEKHHPKGVSQAYADIAKILGGHGFDRAQYSLYLSKGPSDDMAKLFAAILALKAQPWFSLCVTDIRAFRVDQWSDFTGLIRT